MDGPFTNLSPILNFPREEFEFTTHSALNMDKRVANGGFTASSMPNNLLPHARPGASFGSSRVDFISSDLNNLLRSEFWRHSQLGMQRNYIGH